MHFWKHLESDSDLTYTPILHRCNATDFNGVTLDLRSGTFTSTQTFHRGIHQAPAQCQECMKHLRLLYQRTKGSNSCPGRGPWTCPFYDELDQVLSRVPSPEPEVVLDPSPPRSPGFIIQWGADESQGRRQQENMGTAEKQKHVNMHLCPVELAEQTRTEESEEDLKPQQELEPEAVLVHVENENLLQLPVTLLAQMEEAVCAVDQRVQALLMNQIAVFVVEKSIDRDE
ncbi:hypothetical protein UY3_06399 [Chelonia mydas]|uniref:Uncharacterized protein n=1 Tax=Chelonia mydas TaxID=8469 RepID=M7C776_CHEMY|nr:hypothetical protein UY3_06399 [Chelonia mydas]